MQSRDVGVSRRRRGAKECLLINLFDHSIGTDRKTVFSYSPRLCVSARKNEKNAEPFDSTFEFNMSNSLLQR